MNNNKIDLVHIFLITSISNIVINHLLQNNFIYLFIANILLLASFFIGIICESRYDIVRKVGRVNFTKIKNLINYDSDEPEIKNSNDISSGSDDE